MQREESDKFIRWCIPGAVGCFLYCFLVKALNADFESKYKRVKSLQYLCGIFTVAAALAIHLWSATLAWFTTCLGPRIGAEAALTAVTAYSGYHAHGNSVTCTPLPYPHPMQRYFCHDGKIFIQSNKAHALKGHSSLSTCVGGCQKRLCLF